MSEALVPRPFSALAQRTVGSEAEGVVGRWRLARLHGGHRYGGRCPTQGRDKTAVDTLARLTAELKTKTTSLEQVRRLIFGPRTESSSCSDGAGGYRLSHFY